MSFPRFDYYQSSRAQETIPMVEPIENRFHRTMATAAIWGACCGWCQSRPVPSHAENHGGSGAPTVLVIKR